MGKRGKTALGTGRVKICECSASVSANSAAESTMARIQTHFHCTPLVTAPLAARYCCCPPLLSSSSSPLLLLLYTYFSTRLLYSVFYSRVEYDAQLPVLTWIGFRLSRLGALYLVSPLQVCRARRCHARCHAAMPAYLFAYSH